MNIGDTVYFLYDYNLEKGVVVSVGPKNLRIEMQILGSDSKNQPYEVKQSREKCAAPDESIAVVWELWKGNNDRGGYRLERELYADQRMPAKNWPHQKLIWEEENNARTI